MTTTQPAATDPVPVRVARWWGIAFSALFTGLSWLLAASGSALLGWLRRGEQGGARPA